MSRLQDDQATLTDNRVLLRALLLPAADDQVDVEEWVIGEQRFVATIGGVTARLPVPEWPVPTGWFETLEAAIRRERLPRQLCWIRFYYGHMNDETSVVEVLLNNEPWPEIEAVMQRLPWPSSDRFYSVRLFLILRPAL